MSEVDKPVDFSSTYVDINELFLSALKNLPYKFSWSLHGEQLMSKKNLWRFKRIPVEWPKPGVEITLADNTTYIVGKNGNYIKKV